MADCCCRDCVGTPPLHLTSGVVTGWDGLQGYAQRARFYAVSDAGRLEYSKRVAQYICFLARTTGLSTPETVAMVEAKLNGYVSYAELLSDIKCSTDSRL